MKKATFFITFSIIACNINTDSRFSPNSPEGIILRIEKAHNNKNLDSILDNTDFETVARRTLAKSKFPLNDSILFYMTEAMRLSEIKQIKEQGFYYFKNEKSHQFSNKKFIDDSTVSIIDENSNPPQELLVVRRKGKWLYIGPK